MATPSLAETMLETFTSLKSTLSDLEEGLPPVDNVVEVLERGRDMCEEFIGLPRRHFIYWCLHREGISTDFDLLRELMRTIDEAYEDEVGRIADHPQIRSFIDHLEEIRGALERQNRAPAEAHTPSAEAEEVIEAPETEWEPVW